MEAVLEDGHICLDASCEEDIAMETALLLTTFFFFFFLRFVKFCESVKVIQIDSKVLQLWTP